MSRATGLFVKNARLQKGWTQQQAADRAGVSRRQLAAFEAGENVTFDTFEKIVAALELTEVPIAGGATRALTMSGAIDVAALVQVADTLTALADRVREIAVASLLPHQVRRGDAAAIAAFLDESAGLPAEDMAHVGNALRRFASDVMQQQPEAHGATASARSRRKRQA